MPKQIWRNWWIVAMGVAIGLVGAAAFTSASAPVYVSTAKVYVSSRTSADGSELVQGSQFAQQQIASYVQLATSPLVLQPVIARLNLPVTSGELAQQVGASSPEGTSLIALQATGGDKRQVALVVNAVADELIKAVATLERPTASTPSVVRGAVVERGVEPARAISPRPAYNFGLGLLLGLILGVVASMARESWHDRERRPDPNDELGLPVLGALADVPQVQLAGLPHAVPVHRTLDDFRRIRINLGPGLFRAGGSAVLITSATDREGKTTLAAGLASALAEDGARVVVLDADLRNRELSRRLAPHAASGLTRLLRPDGPDPVDSVVALEGFDVLPAGDAVADPGALLTRRLLTPLLDHLRRRYDVVLIDAPSIAASSDALALSLLAGMTVLVADPSTTPAALKAAAGAIEAAGGTVAGAVLNGHHDKTAGRSRVRTSRQQRHSTDRQGGGSLEQRGLGSRMARGVRGVGERVRHVRGDVSGGRPALPLVRRPEPLPRTPSAGDVPGA